MKKIMYLSFLIVFIVTAACNKEAKKSTPNCCLSREDSLSIINEIIETTDAYATANNNLDAEQCAEFYDSSSDFVFAETGREYPNWDSLCNDIKNWYSQPLDSVQMIWTDRVINPLNHNAVTLYSKFSFMARFKSGAVYKSMGSLTGLLTKKDGKWKMTQGYVAIEVLEH